MSVVKMIAVIFLLCFSWIEAQEPIPSNETVQGDSIKLLGEQNIQPVAVQKNPRGVMLRSIFVPGWGQFYNEKWLKGVIVAGAECGIIVNAIIQNQYALNSVTTLEKEFYINNRNLSYWWLAGVILYSAVDAYVDAHLFDFDESPNLSLNMKSIDREFFSFSPNALFSLEWHF